MPPMTPMTWSYEAGSVEKLWHNATGRNCDAIRRSWPLPGMHESLRYTANAFGKEAPVATALQQDALSKLGNGHCDELLEPLTGAVRHPFAEHSGCWLHKAGIRQTLKYNLTYLLPVNGCVRGKLGCSAGGRRVGKVGSRNLFYDLGCSTYRDTGDISISGGYGSSLPLFQRLYARNCIVFDAIWAWEATPHDRKAWMRSVPKEVQAKLSFFNIPVTEENALQTLVQTATPDDFVVVKVDIDHPALEKAIVSRIANEPKLSALIDELFFEYHIHVGDHAPPLPQAAPHLSPDTVGEALGLMQRLRAQGVRSHFWV